MIYFCFPAVLLLLSVVTMVLVCYYSPTSELIATVRLRICVNINNLGAGCGAINRQVPLHLYNKQKFTQIVRVHDY